MNYALDILIHEIFERKVLLEEFQQQPDKLMDKYSVSLEQLKQIREGDFLALHAQEVHPFSIMKLARVLGMDVMERYQQLKNS
jgi:DNA-directed RNA polymerase subunit H (RpoH/RPB5)